VIERPVVAIIQFPGSNDERDAAWSLGALGAAPVLVWHEERALPEETGAVVLPGGFSYGDYLRSGAIASLAPAMDAVRRFAAAGGPTFEVTFGLLRATERPRKGVFVTVTGGPGTSGLAAADGYTEAFDPRIPRHYDIVFFDQRGIGLSEPLQCPDAALAFYTSSHVPTVGRAEAEAFAADSRTFASDCIDETGVDPANLAYYGTDQAIEDLEAFRVWLKADQIDLYGESYGTQYVQTYAAAHPTGSIR